MTFRLSKTLITMRSWSVNRCLVKETFERKNDNVLRVSNLLFPSLIFCPFLKGEKRRLTHKVAVTVNAFGQLRQINANSQQHYTVCSWIVRSIISQLLNKKRSWLNHRIANEFPLPILINYHFIKRFAHSTEHYAPETFKMGS